ncbi:MAG: anion permease [Alphaproteobacteria bacterium]|nr:anion permease [Alphaproteobacteria bacterium]
MPKSQQIHKAASVIPLHESELHAIDQRELNPKNFVWNGVKIIPFLAVMTLAIGLWFSPTPEGLDIKTWHLFTIFLSTIAGIIVKPLPMGSIAVIALSACTLTHTLTLEEALNSFSSKIVWLVLAAFFIARGFIKTGLGSRIAYYFVGGMGKSTLGLGYSLVLTELLLAPVVPSSTARGGGIVFPIVSALNQEYGSHPEDGTHRKIGAYLFKLCFHANTITGAMFITALAGNPLIVSLASKVNVNLSWHTWALAAIVPGILCLVTLPLLLFVIYPPQLKSTPEAPDVARNKLKQMGSMSFEEKIMLTTFLTLLGLWIFGPQVGIDAGTAAIFGLAVLMLTGVLNWDDVLHEHAAWNTFIWLGCLLMMAELLNELGMMMWVSNHIQTAVGTLDWVSAMAVLVLVYFFSHYLFAGITSHITSMYSAFLVVSIAAGAPPMFAALLYAALSSLSGGLTHYGTGTGPVFFGAGYLSISEWWRLGAIVSVVNLLIWVTAGSLWWKIIGLW